MTTPLVGTADHITSATGPWPWVWAAAILLPLLTAVGLWLTRAGSRRTSDLLTKYAALTFVPSIALALAGPEAGSVEATWLLLGTYLQVDTIGRPLLLVAGLLYGAAAITVWSSRTERRDTLTAFLLLSFVGNAGVFVAADTVTFYLSFALMSLAAYGLVVHGRTAASRRAGRIYIGLTMLSEMAVLAAMLLVVQAGGRMLVDAPAAVAASDHRNIVIALLVLGFGIKAGTFPLHVWLPLAHPAAPPPASAVLSGTMIKAGLVGWLRFLPLGEIALPGWGAAIVALSLVGAFAALAPGVLQKDPKVALAYSSISQMGFLGVLVGTALASPEVAPACVLAGIVYAVHHGIAKGGLFLGVSVWRNHAYGWIRWWVLGGLALLALAVAGAPFGSGAVAKYASKEALGDSTFLWFSLADLLPFVGTVSTILLLRGGWLLITGSREHAWGVDGAVVSWSILILGGTVLTWYLAGQWAGVVSVPGLDTTTLWDATWPILLGVALAAVAWWPAHRRLLPQWAAHPDGETVPPGDLVVPEERVVEAVRTTLSRASQAASAADAEAIARVRRRWHARSHDSAERADAHIGTWLCSGAALALVTAATIVIVVISV